MKFSDELDSYDDHSPSEQFLDIFGTITVKDKLFGLSGLESIVLKNKMNYPRLFYCKFA